jgi:hypothetical protein
MLSFAVTACTTAEKYSFTRLGQTYDQNTGQLVNPAEPPTLSDGLALNFASSVASVLRSKFNGTRIANEVANTVQVTLAALAGAGAAFDFGASAVTALGLSSAGIPQFQRIFMVQGRIDAYQDAVRLIEEAEIEYLAFNQYPSSTVLTQNGVTLFQRVTASIHLVEKTLGGRIPSLADTEKATEPMTQAGSIATLPGSPVFNNIPANPRLAAAVIHPLRNPETISSSEFGKLKQRLNNLENERPQFVEFLKYLRAINRDLSLSSEEKKGLFAAALSEAGITGISPSPNEMIDFFRTASDGDKGALIRALKKRVPPTLSPTPSPTPSPATSPT